MLYRFDQAPAWLAPLRGPSHCGAENDTRMKNRAALDVPELSAVGDVAVVLGKHARNGGDDAGLVGA